MKSFVVILVIALCGVAHSEEEKNQDKRAIIYSSYGFPYTPYISYVPTVFKRDTAAVEANTEDEKNVDKRAVVIGSPLVYPYSSYYTWPYTLVKRETEESSEHAIQKREVNQEEEKNVDKRSIILRSHLHSYYTHPLSYVHPIFKRDTAAAEASDVEKNVDKRAILVGSPLVYPLRSYYTWPYGIVKRETEESSEHNIQKREATETEAKMQEKRDLLLGYGYHYRYYGYPSFRYWL